MDHFNDLEPCDDEMLTVLSEECAEVIQAVSKIQRHGWHSVHPSGGLTNREDLEKELGHIALAVSPTAQRSRYAPRPDR